ncbi:MAG: hypothetical protein E7048_11035 [Lentisphaerae bacterium]|nr:hypothetical protein [Lentisphaerota bacterium]
MSHYHTGSRPVWTAGLIVGNLIGAGILALPVSLGICGMVPSLILMILYGALMLYSAEVLSREAVERKRASFDLPSLYSTYLGRWARWAAVITNGIILYGLLTAYISGASQIIADLTGANGIKSLIVPVVAIILSLLAIMDFSAINKYNALLVGTLICAFGALLFLSFPAIHFSRLQESHWRYATLAIPLIVTACHFHNIIPLLCRNLDWDLRAMRKAVILGMAIAFAMNLLWTLCGIGTLPRHGDNSLVLAYLSNLPATVPMGNILNSKIFVVIAVYFSLAAIATSFIANGIGLMNFLSDMLTSERRGPGLSQKQKNFIRAAAFVPPAVIALIKPEIFIKALDVAGGVGIVTLFGILPCLIAIFRKNNSSLFRTAGIFFLCLALIALITASYNLWQGKPELSPECSTSHGNKTFIMKGSVKQ